MSAQRIPRASFVRLLGLLLLFTAAGAQARLPETLPPALQPWVDWVLADSPEHACPFLYTGSARQCAWPSRLDLDVGQTGGGFSQQWQVYSEGWLTLPGGPGQWPMQVTANGEPVAVSAQGQAPAVYLPAGDYELAGRFQWTATPKSLPLPAAVGLLALTVNGRPVSFPVIDPASAILWIQKTGTAEEGRVEDRLQVQRFRRILDDLPMQVETRLRLQVSGRQREVLIDHPMLAGAIPLRVDSPLPARLEPDGRLRVQLRPGEWWLSVHSRHPGEVTSLSTPSAEPEVWSFQAVNALRLVELAGAPTIDPRQTLMPGEWHGLPAYRMAPGSRLVFNVQRHGDPVPEPNRLTISREAWLDFDGGGYTVRDRITGSMTSGWRLDTLPEYRPGRVLLHGRPQFITRLDEDAGAGVEVRRGQIDLLSDGRLSSPIDRLDAVGWRQDFAQADFTLHLPPGWRLLSVSGMDNVPATWLQRWTVLDLFMVLITTLAVARLWGWRWLVPALLTLALLWHEPGAPRFVWLNIVAAVALLRLVPQASRVHLALQVYRALSLFALLVIALPFMVDQVRTGLYPQLEHPYQAAMPGTYQARAPRPGAEQEAAVNESPAEYAADALVRKLEQPGGPVTSLYAPVLPEGRVASRSIVEFDPQAIVQTGPGLPQWQWNRVEFGWNGPVQQGQAIELIYLSPAQNLWLNLLRVALLLVLAGRFVGRAEIGRWLPGRTAVSGLLLAVALLPVPPDALASDIPTPVLLDQLKQRLLEAPACAPACAAIPQMTLTASGGELQLGLQVHAHDRVAVPLPGRADHWLPTAVVLDGRPALLYRDARGVLWALLPPGIHRLAMNGPLPQRSTVQIPLQLRPQRVRAEMEGWILDGLDEQASPAAQLQLTRKQVATGPADASNETLEPAELPSFVSIERTLQLGLEWRVQTRVLRASPTGTAVVLRVPLLPGESVTSPDVRVEGGQVRVQLPANARQMVWNSVLAHGDIRLQASRQTDWVERWLLDVSPVWHVVAEGIAVVHHTDAQRQWLPEWRPWPGQSLQLQVTRPAGVAGRSLTIESAGLRLSPGLRASDHQLSLAIRASQGGRHALRLPADARLQSVSIDGEAQPIRQQGQVVELPVRPGLQRVDLAWRSPTAITSLFTTPEIDLGAAAVNTSLSVSLGQDRWILFLDGPAMGPAVQWWGVLVVVLIAALILHRLPFSPLRHYQWVLLALGLTQTGLFVPLLVGGWLLALGLRGRLSMPEDAGRFDLIQALLAFWTLLALLMLFVSIQQGLLGRPDMLVAGNRSSATLLNWYQDRSSGMFPRAWVLSLPLLAYRLVMLAWALWLAFALLRWLRMGWQSFSHQGLWRKPQKMPKRKKEAAKGADPWTEES